MEQDPGVPGQRWDIVPHAPELGRLWHLLVLGYRRSLLGAAVVVACAGALTAPAHLTLLVGPAVGALAVGGACLGAACAGLRPPSARTAALTGLGGMLSIPFICGVPLLGPAGAVLTMALLVTAASRLPEDIAGPDPVPVLPVDVAALRAELRHIPSPVLLDHWHRTARLLRGRLGPDALAAVTGLRSSLLDELARRDPAGVERWLRSGGDDPRRHLTSGDPDRRT